MSVELTRAESGSTLHRSSNDASHHSRLPTGSALDEKFSSASADAAGAVAGDDSKKLNYFSNGNTVLNEKHNDDAGSGNLPEGEEPVDVAPQQDSIPDTVGFFQLFR